MDLLTNAKLLRAFGFKCQQWIFEGQGTPTTSLPPDIPPVDHEETSRTSYWSGFVSREDATITWWRNLSFGCTQGGLWVESTTFWGLGGGWADGHPSAAVGWCWCQVATHRVDQPHWRCVCFLQPWSNHQRSLHIAKTAKLKKEVQRMHCMHVCETSKGHAQIRDITSALRPAWQLTSEMLPRLHEKSLVYSEVKTWFLCVIIYMKLRGVHEIQPRTEGKARCLWEFAPFFLKFK